MDDTSRAVSALSGHIELLMFVAVEFDVDRFCEENLIDSLVAIASRGGRGHTFGPYSERYITALFLFSFAPATKMSLAKRLTESSFPRYTIPPWALRNQGRSGTGTGSKGRILVKYQKELQSLISSDRESMVTWQPF